VGSEDKGRLEGDSGKYYSGGILMVHKMKWKINIADQDDKVVSFQVLKDGKVEFENSQFDKDELIELITEGNYDYDVIHARRARVE
jgi:hypothetical protein